MLLVPPSFLFHKYDVLRDQGKTSRTPQQVYITGALSGIHGTDAVVLDQLLNQTFPG